MKTFEELRRNALAGDKPSQLDCFGLGELLLGYMIIHLVSIDKRY